MVPILALTMTVVCYSCQNIFVKNYQNHCDVGMMQNVSFYFSKSMMTIVVFFVLNGFTWVITPITIWFSLLMTVSSFVAVSASMQAYSIGKISIVNMFVLLGSALVPAFYGIVFLGEKLTITKLFGVLVTCLAILPVTLFSAEKRCYTSRKGLFLFLCILCFLSNGFAGLLLKLNQISIGTAPANDFLLMTSTFNVISCGAFMVISAVGRHKGQQQFLPIERRFFDKKSLIAALGLCIFNGTASVLSMFAARYLPSSVQFPAISGGQLLLNPFVGWLFFKEKITWRDITGMLLALIAVYLFAL